MEETESFTNPTEIISPEDKQVKSKDAGVPAFYLASTQTSNGGLSKTMIIF